jgi:DNA adenine methylase
MSQPSNTPSPAASCPAASTSRARPFLRWPGGKQWLVPHIRSLIPPEFRTYYEPFLGGGSVFLGLAPPSSVLGDISSQLIDTYSAVRDNPNSVISWLSRWPNSRSKYLLIREARYSGRYKRAARFIYLNKTCWNGLYRVDRSGRFNVPYGNDPSRRTHDPTHIIAASRLLAPASLRCGDFEDHLETASEGDLIYIDPPYVNLHSDNGFRRYNERLFTWDDQRRLAALAGRLAGMGCYVIASNAAAPSVIALYGAFSTLILERSSLLAADPASRRRTAEALFVSPNLNRRLTSG